MPEHSFPLDGPISLDVRLAHGSVTVETADALAEASVHLEPGRHGDELLAQTAVELRGSTLVVHAPRQGGIFDLARFGGWRGKAELDVHLVVPTGTPVKISTFTAEIRIPGEVGNADLAWGAADAALRQVDGDLRLRFGSGTVRAVQVTGSVQLRSGSGDAQLGEVGGALTSGCGSGNLQVRVVRGSVRARAGSGDARLGAVHGDVDVTSGSGALEIGLPEGVCAQLSVTSGSGRVHSELPIEDAPRESGKPIRIRARTGSGDVRLFRAA
jgi:Tfp pilus assembly protein PilX